MNAPRTGRLTPLRRLGAPGLIGTTVLAVITAVTLAGPYLLATDGRARVADPFARPGPGLPLGADDIGRDLFAQLVIGARTSLGMAAVVAIAATAVCALVGGAAGIGPRWLASLLMRTVDIVLALPTLVILLLGAAFLGQSFATRATLLVILLWALYARVIRAGVLTAWSQGHLEAAQAMGAPRRHLLLRHASYIVAPLLIPIFVRTAMITVLLDSALSFLGLGDPTTPSWGTTLYWAQVNGVFLTDAWQWWAMPPGLAITTTVVSLALIGVAAEDRINPVLRDSR